MDQPANPNQQLIRWLRAEMARSTGKRYQVKLELLDAVWPGGGTCKCSPSC
jgi:hypothetical protein